MDSTMVYQLIQEQLNKPKQLVNLLPTLAHLLRPQARITTTNMNQQQIFKQIYNCLNKVIQNTSTEKNQLLQALEANYQPEAENQEQEQQEDQAEGEEGGQLDNQNNQQALQNQDDGEEMKDQGEEGEGEEGDNEDDLIDEQLMEGEEDVGLYGQEIDEQDMQDYQNQGNSQQDKQFEEQDKYIQKKSGKKPVEEDDEGDDLIDDQFDHFRQIQLQNKEEEQTTQQKNDLQKQIQKLEHKIIDRKDWALKGEVKATQRPVNSLLQYDLQFNTGIRLNQQITPEINDDMEKIIKQRILDELYDDRVRYQPSQALREQFGSLKEVSREKSKLGLAQLYESDFKNYLGLGQNKQDKLKTQIMQAFKQVNYALDSLSNCHFTPRPTASSRNEAVITEQKVPVATFKGGKVQTTKPLQHNYISEKQEDKKGKRTKNKHIERQRRKEQSKKKLNKKIQYGGVTKFQAKAMAKKAKNNLNASNIKYNKSANFFGQMNKDKSKKPNPNVGKLQM